MINSIKPIHRLVNIVRTVARKSSNRLKFCWLKAICCTCQSNELEREIKHKTGGQEGGQPKIWGAMIHPCSPLEPPLPMPVVTFWGPAVAKISVVIFYLRTFATQRQGSAINIGLWEERPADFRWRKTRKSGKCRLSFTEKTVLTAKTWIAAHKKQWPQ